MLLLLLLLLLDAGLMPARVGSESSTSQFWSISNFST